MEFKVNIQSDRQDDRAIIELPAPKRGLRLLRTFRARYPQAQDFDLTESFKVSHEAFLTLTEAEATRCGTLFDFATIVSITVPPRSLNPYVSAEYSVSNDQTIITLTPIIDGAAIFADWVEAGCPLRWTPKRKAPTPADPLSPVTPLDPPDPATQEQVDLTTLSQLAKEDFNG